MKAGPEIREVVTFTRMNLNDPAYSVSGTFDFIFCRNVLIYFDRESKTKVVERLMTHLAPDGCLFPGLCGNHDNHYRSTRQHWSQRLRPRRGGKRCEAMAV
jgi:chemotaxis methyl-accepting protein methylase